MSDEDGRIDELRKMEILDQPVDGSFEDICVLATRFFDVPVSIVSLVDSDRVWFGAAEGVGDLRQIDRGPGLCDSAILRDDVYVANDLREDPNSLANPLVAQENGFRFYAGAPLITKAGHRLGTVCVMDFEPREFSEEDQEVLQRLSRLVMTHMVQRLDSRKVASLAEEIDQKNEQLEYVAHHDGLTGLLNRSTMETLAPAMRQRSEATAYLMFDVDHFKDVNDKYGHAAGDEVLREVAVRLTKAVRDGDVVARFGGEEFSVLLSPTSTDAAVETAERIRRSVCETPITWEGGSMFVTMSGGVFVAGEDGPDHEHCLKAADEALYAAKRGGRNRIVLIRYKDGAAEFETPFAEEAA